MVLLKTSFDHRKVNYLIFSVVVCTDELVS